MSNTSPGWYPDSGDPSRLRYWDGTAWTEHTSRAGPAPTAPTGATAVPADSKKNWFLRHKILTAVGAFLLIIIIVAAAGGGGDSDDDGNTASDDNSSSSEPTKDAEPTKEAEPTEAAEPTEEAEPTQEPEPPTDLDIITEEITGDSDTEDQNLTVTKTRKGVYEVGFDIDDNVTDDLIESAAIRDAFSILEEASKADAPFKRIAIRGYFPLVDKNVQEIPHDEAWILYGEFTAETVSLLNPDNIDTGDRDALDAVSADGVVWMESVFD